MASKTKRRRPKVRQTLAPRPQAAPSRHRRWWLYGAAGAAIAAIAGTITILALGGGGGGGGSKGSAGLPVAPDYHSLLVNPADPQKIVLGTHSGLYVSADGGHHWRYDALSGNDAMNLARPSRRTLWVAGHDVFKKSVDNGATWRDVRPAGLPTLD